MTELIRVSEAAKRLKVTRSAVYQMIGSKLLVTVEIGGYKLINSDDLLRDEVVNRKQGRPPKK